MERLNGRGQIRLPPRVVAIVLPTCARCKKTAPQCDCGRPQNTYYVPRTKENE